MILRAYPIIYVNAEVAYLHKCKVALNIPMRQGIILIHRGIMTIEHFRIFRQYVMAMIITTHVVGATKIAQIEDIAATVNLHLTKEDIAYLGDPYIPHALAGVMAQNRPAMTDTPVWTVGSKLLK